MAALPTLTADKRLVGVAAGGSFLTKTMDAYSDIDLVLVAEPGGYEDLLATRIDLAERLGNLLVAFTGEHVGEPRLLICLYDNPLTHVDLKVVRPEDLVQRVEDPAILWERDDLVSAALAKGTAHFPEPDHQWLEDRFWVWIHYLTAKIARGELFEAHDGLAFLRNAVLGPLGLQQAGARPTGVRKVEQITPELATQLQTTLAPYTARGCADALEAAAELYRALRANSTSALIHRKAAETAAMAWLAEIKRGLD